MTIEQLLSRLTPLSAAISRSRRPFGTGKTAAAIERLEDRTLLAGTWGGGFPAGTNGNASVTTLPKDNVDVAIADDGHYVAIWQETHSPGDPLYYRRFQSNGMPLDPAEQTVGFNLKDASVGMAADGRFVITFVDAGGQVRFNRYAANGTLLQNAVLVGSTTIPGADPEVAVADDGRFVIAWQQLSDNSPDIVVDIFAADGSSAPGFIGVDQVGSNPDTAINPVTGEFVVVWSGRYRAIFRADGTVLSGKRTLPGGVMDSKVAMNAAGDVIYAWVAGRYEEGSSITEFWYGTENYYTQPGAPPAATRLDIGSVDEFGISGSIISNPRIASSNDGGTFIVVWDHDWSRSGITTHSWAFSQGVESSISDVPSLEDGDIAMNARGDFVFATIDQLRTGDVFHSAAVAEFHRYQPFDQIGAFSKGVWTLDLNADNVFDTGDTRFIFGQAGDLPVTGDWNGDGLTEIGVFRNGTWILDVNDNRRLDAADAVFGYGLAGDQPVVGDWNDDGIDEIGVFRNGTWFIDVDRDYSFTARDAVFNFGLPGDVAVVGDLDNSGKPMAVVFRDGHWYTDTNRNGVWEEDVDRHNHWEGIDRHIVYGAPGDRPIPMNMVEPSFPGGGDELAFVRDGAWYVDLYDDPQPEPDVVIAPFGPPGAVPVRGAWSTLAKEGSEIEPRGRSEIAVFRDGRWILDGNGNGSFDPTIDLVFTFGQAGDLPVGGDWNADGFDEVGVFRDGWWFLDTNGNFTSDAADAAFVFGAPGDQPVVGDWNGDGRDDVGVVRNGIWYLDSDGDKVFEGTDVVFSFGNAGDRAVTGDWNGDGRDEVGVFAGGDWLLDYDGSWSATASDRTVQNYGLAGDQTIAGDWDGDGFDDVGVARDGTWFLDQNGSDTFDALDWLFSYGLASDLALAGRWQVPV